MPEDDANRLRRHAEDALGGAYDPSRVLPILHRLAKHAEVGSDDALFAHLRLAELLVAKSPWRASIHARKVLALHPGEDRAWAILGLSQALLGHYRFARTAYEGAVRAAPQNPFYAHNLGHLIDVALDAPRDALPWLRRAAELAPNHPDVLTSLAHAHARLGDFVQARDLLAPLRSLLSPSMTRASGSATGSAQRRRPLDTGTGLGGPRSELARLIRWVDRALHTQAPEPERPARTRLGASVPRPASRVSRVSRPSPRKSGTKTKGALELLTRGLSHLPFSPKQLSRAKALARHVRLRLDLTAAAAVEPAALAAAIAYAIVYVDQVPLSAGEVAAPFRVSATRVRAAFEILRSQLDLIRGDVRFASEAR